MHKDIIGKEILIGYWVVYSSFNQLKVGQIIKLTPKQVLISPIKSYKSIRKYPYDVNVIDNKYVTLFLLNHDVDTNGKT